MRTLFLIFCTVTSPLLGTITIQISPSVSSPQLVGTPITLTAVASDTQAGTLDYQFSVALAGQSPQVVMDFSLQNAFTWAPSSREGAYIIQVIARNKTGGDSVSAQLPFEIQSRVTGAKSVISPTAHPLVALYSAPPCPAGSSIYVVFGTAGSTNRTDQRSCDGQTSVNFYIAGMLATTTYEMYAVTVTGPDADLGPAASFTTGAIPTDLQFPPTSLLIPPGAQVETDQSVLFIANSSIDLGGFGLFYFPTATDLNGNVIWYYSVLGTRLQAPDYFTRTVDGGTVLLIASDPDSDRADIRGQIWREIDLAGNTIRQTNATRITEQLNALGLFGVTDFDHDSIRLPNGHTLILCSQELMYPAQTQASPVPLDVIGDAIVDLDENLQVAWSWSAFDHMDVNRAAILGETCAPFAGGCVPVYLAPIAADWLHGNSLNFIPSSGDVLLSLRDQDWVIKIDYANGIGSGAVLWELGQGGSFTIDSSDPLPWFSHQHDAEYELGGTTILSLFDNGNTRTTKVPPGVTENSRGMVLDIDETAMTVTPILLQDLGVYSPAVGSAQRLDNGNYQFDAGFVSPGPNEFALHQEYTPSGAAVFRFQTNTLAYRDYRMRSLYQLKNTRQLPQLRPSWRE